jgi:hypothetical protein
MGSNSSNIKHQHRFASTLTLPPRNSCIHRQSMILPGQPISPPICCSKPTLDYHSHLHNNSIILHPTSNNNLSTTNPLPSTELVQWHLLHLQSLSSLSSRAISASNSATKANPSQLMSHHPRCPSPVPSGRSLSSRHGSQW